MAGYIGTKSVSLSTDAATISGDITVSGTVDGRDVAADGVTADAALPKAGGALTGAVTTNSTFDGVDIASRDAVLTATTTTANAALPKAGGTLTGDLTLAGGGLISSDGTGDTLVISGSTAVNTGGNITLEGNTASDVSQIKFKNGSTEVMRIVGGRVGIGVTNPAGYDGEAGNLVVASSDHTGITIASTGTDKRTNLYFSDGTSGTAAYIGGFSYDHSNNNLLIRTGGAERMRLDASGNVGIGISTVNNTYSSSHALQIASVSDNNWGGTLILSSANGSSVFSRLVNSTDGLDIINQVNTPMRFFTNNTERMRLSANGDLSIRITSAVAFSTTYAFFLKDGGAGCSVFKSTAGAGFASINSWNAATSGTRYHLYFREGTAGTVRGSITSNGSATAYNTSSDYRLKENVDYDWDATTRLKQLKPARFNWIADADTTVDGFLAHEAQAVVPECVTGTKDAMMDEEYEVSAAVEEVTDADGNVTTEAVDAVIGTRSVPDMQGIDQSKLVPLLVKTIQELEARIAALEDV